MPENTHRTLTNLMTSLSLLCILTFPQDLSAQEVIPDGTDGQMLEVLEQDTVPEKWKDKRWRLFPGKFSTLKLGGGFLYEFAGYIPDDEAKQQMDSIGSSLDPEFSVRDFRVTMSGQFKTKRTISWKAGFMYDGNSGTWLVRETGVMINVPELWGNFFIGRTKEGFSMNKVMVGYAGWTMERQMALDMIPILADGIKWLGYLPESKIFWNAGVYTDWLSEGQSFSTYRWQVAIRAGMLPVFEPEENRILHTGLSYRFGKPADGDIQVRSKPEVNAAPFFIESGKFLAENSNHLGVEIYYKSGSLLFGTEIYRHRFSSSESANPIYMGGDMVLSYVLTGESRPYHTATGIFGFIPVDRPVFRGGPGAWEVLVRYSRLDLNDGNISGGEFWRITPMVNWYLTKDIRLELAYGYGVLDRFNLSGGTQFFQARIQIALI